MKVHTALAKAFLEEGAIDVFGVMGNANLEWWLDLVAGGATVHSTRHEGPGVSMAEGWARATGRPGVATVTRGPGTTQTATALTVALRGRVPLVLFAGDSPLGVKTESQYLDQPKFFKALDVGFVELLKPGDAWDVAREAFLRARVESRPIVLNVPSDVGDQTFPDPLEDYVPSSAWLARAGQRMEPDPERVREAVEIIAASRRPVIVLGLGGGTAGAVPAAERLGERIGALLSTTWPMKGSLESEWNARIAGQLCTKTAGELFAEADCVIGIGASMDQRTLAGGYGFSGGPRYIHIDRRPVYVMGNGRVADCYLQADARVAVEAIDRALAEAGVAGTGYRTDEVRGRLRAMDEDPDPREIEIEPGLVDPRTAVRALDDALPSEVGVICGMAHHTGIVAIELRRPRPFQWMTNPFSCVGQVLPTAIGAATALRPAPLVAIEGDVGAMMHVNELDTAARIGLKLLLVVLNDEGLGNEYQRLVARGLPWEQATVPSPDLGAVGRSLGCRGTLVRTVEDLRQGVEQFLAGDGPMVIDVRTSRRVASVAYRRLEFGLDD